jgi:hypothetical protein
MDTIVRKYKGHRIAKEWYAQGISMFEYWVTKEGTEVCKSFPTLREAKAWVDVRANAVKES